VEHVNGWPGSAGEHLLQERQSSTERAHRFYSQQVLDHLNARMREFVAEQEMMFVATADSKGECDNTFRAGPPGFVHVLSPTRLAWPEYRGNGVMASMGNVAENPHVGILFVDFFRHVIGLHVNGTARTVDDRAMRMACRDLPVDQVPGLRPERWVVVTVEEAYIHCAKHIPRLIKLPHGRAWGTDDVRRKGGDYFGAAAEAKTRAPRPEVDADPRVLPRQRPPMSARSELASPAVANNGGSLHAPAETCAD